MVISIALALLVMAGAVRAQAPEGVVVLEEGLEIDLGGLEKLRPREPSRGRFETRNERYRGKLDGEWVDLTVRYRDQGGWAARPRWALDRVERDLREGTEPLRFGRRAVHTGAFGPMPWLVVGIAPPGDDTSGSSRGDWVVAFGGMGAEGLYALEFHFRERADEDVLPRLQAFVDGAVRWSGPAADPRWRDETLEEVWGWASPVPASERRGSDFEAIRSDHFVVLTDASVRKKLGKMLDEIYERVQELLQLEDVEGEPLLPLVLFDSEETYAACHRKLKGGSEDDRIEFRNFSDSGVFITWFRTPQEQDYAWLLTFEVLDQRLRGFGNAPWFWDGVPTYVRRPAAERKRFQRRVKKEEYEPLAEFLTREHFGSDLDGRRADGGSDRRDRLDQAAAFVEFLVEDRDTAKAWPAFAARAANLAYDDRQALDELVQQTYACDLDELEERFVRYWRKR